MGSFDKEQFEQLTRDPQNVRNVSVIAHVDHGKTTLTDSLMARAGLLKHGQAGDRRLTDTRKDEQERGITIKSTAVSLVYSIADDHSVDVDDTAAVIPDDVNVSNTDKLLVNLIDSPGHVDFSSEVTAALRVSDGALVVVDAISGVCVQTETVLRQALAERIRPVLVINKLDRCILEKQNDPEELYQGLSRIIACVNGVIQTYSETSGPLSDILLDPAKGNVAFAAGLQGWGFTLPQIARVYCKKTKGDEKKMTRRLWGNNFYDEDTKKWTSSRTAESQNCQRGFCKYVLDPVYKILKACSSGETSTALDLASKLGVTVPQAETDTGKARDLIRSIMGRWLPAADAMLTLMKDHLPDPRQAQAYRAELLYEGPMDDEAAVAMKTCDPDGPLMMFVSKMFPSNEKARFLAFGRVFSGTLTGGQKVYILDGDKRHETVVSRANAMIAGATKMVDFVPCGSVCALGGIDKFLSKTGTLTTFKGAHNFKRLNFSVSPVVQVAVQAQKAADLPKLIEGLKRLSKVESMVQVTSDSGQSQHIVAGAGELHLEICLKDLEEYYAGVPIKRSQPVVTYKETVSARSSQVCLAKSTNKHNRIYMVAEPLDESLVADIEQGVVHPTQDVKERARYLADHYGWDVTEARKIWSFGPHGTGPNLLVDCTKGVQNISDARDTIVAGFQWATMEGVLSEEAVRGIRFNIVDVKIHTDPACRKGGQIIPAARRAVMAAMLTAQPQLVEPVFLVQIQTPENHLGSVYSVLNKRRGIVIEETQPTSAPVFDLKAHLPVAESFGFCSDLRANTSGQAFPQCSFDHWEPLSGNPLDAGSRVAEIVTEIRQRKGLSPEVPALENFLDKL